MINHLALTQETGRSPDTPISKFQHFNSAHPSISNHPRLFPQHALSHTTTKPSFQAYSMSHGDSLVEIGLLFDEFELSFPNS